jgi:hypothetical protein
MNFKICRSKGSWPNLRHCPGICQEKPKGNKKSLNQESRCPNLNLVPTESEAGVLNATHKFQC